MVRVRGVSTRNVYDLHKLTEEFGEIDADGLTLVITQRPYITDDGLNYTATGVAYNAMEYAIYWPVISQDDEDENCFDIDDFTVRVL